MNEPLATRMPPLLQDLFDAGRDPLDDAVGREWLLAHPEALEAFASIRAALRSPRPTPSAWSRPRTLPRILLAAGMLVAGGLAAVALAVVLLRPDDAAPRLDPRLLPRPSLASAGLVRRCVTREHASDDRLSFVAATEVGNATWLRRTALVTHTTPTSAVRSCTTTIACLQIGLP